MAALDGTQSGCFLRRIRLALLFLLSGTVLTVLVFYTVASGVITANQYRSIIQHSLPMTSYAGSTRHPIKNHSNGHVVAGQQSMQRDKKTGTSLRSGPDDATGNDSTLDPKDYREIDMSETESCDGQCQENIQRLRHEGIAKTCAGSATRKRRPSIWDQHGKLRRFQLPRLNHLFPIDDSKMIYCSVPKDGCSAWKRILLKTAGYDPDRFPNNIHPMFERKIKPLSAYNVTEAERRLRTYNTFLFVREPLDRMLSLFLDKAVSKHDFPFNRTQFGEFLEYILQKPVHERVSGYAEHWTHATYLCLPCDVHYTFIGRLETSKRDASFVFENFVNPSVGMLSMPTKIHKTHSSDPDIRNVYFNQVNKTLLERVYRRYRVDYSMFSYKRPRILRRKRNYKEKPR